jgi:uncharacterized surface protein with fasciclin (FAS1) repeats
MAAAILRCSGDGKSRIGILASMRTWTLAILIAGLSACDSSEEAAAPVNRPAGTAAEAADVTAAITRLPEFSQATLMLEATGVGPELARLPSVTLLVPRDTALAELPPRTVPAMMLPGYTAALRDQLRAMALPQLLTAGELRTQIDESGGTLVLPSIGGASLSFTRVDDMLFVTAGNGARASMGSAEIGAGNGAVYVLDGWLGAVPPPLPAPPENTAQ